MKRILALSLIALLLTPAVSAGRGGPPRERKRLRNLPAATENLPIGELDAAEQADLLYLREEEKVARDVYRDLSRIWSVRAFRNIARSEQVHMDAILGLLLKYGLEDPVGDHGPGVFADKELQALYDAMVARGRQSLVDALTVGTLIEETDIADLATALGRTDEKSVTTVLEHLQRGSRNHLRAFARLLARRNVEVRPTILSAEEFAEIVGSPWERGGPGRGRRRR